MCLILSIALVGLFFMFKAGVDMNAIIIIYAIACIVYQLLRSSDD